MFKASFFRALPCNFQSSATTLANDLYPLVSKGAFRLYYTSASEASQSFSVWISDSFGNEQKLDFEFNVKKE